MRVHYLLRDYLFTLNTLVHDVRNLLQSEAVVRRCSVKKVFLKVFLKKVPEACNFIKKETLTQVFSCEFWEISKNTFFYKTPSVAASVQYEQFLCIMLASFLGVLITTLKTNFFQSETQWRSWLIYITYGWLALSQILDITNFALSRTIYLVPWSFSVLSKQKTLGISNLDISNFCLCRTNFSVLWAGFSGYLELFSKFPNFVLQFLFSN